MNLFHKVDEFIERRNPSPLTYNSGIRTSIARRPGIHIRRSARTSTNAFFETLRVAFLKFIKRGLPSRVSVGARSED